MSTRSNLNGHDTYYDGSTWKYKDTDEVYDKNNERACIKCGKHSTEEGHDHCIGEKCSISSNRVIILAYKGEC